MSRVQYSNLSWLPVLTAWSITLMLLGMVLFRIGWWDGSYLLLWWNAFTWYVYLPIYPVLWWSGCEQRRWLNRLASLVATFHLCWSLPDFVDGVPVRITEAGPPAAVESSDLDTGLGANNVGKLRCFYANVSADNRQFEQLFREIETFSPDLFILVEFSKKWGEAYARSGLRAKYPFFNQIAHPNPSEISIHSRFPLAEVKRKWVRRTLHVTFTLQCPDHEFNFFCLHAPRPIEIPGRDYFEYWQALFPLIASHRQPLVVVGDFNTTQHSKWYHRLRRQGLTSLHELCRRGHATTWPNGLRWLPPIRIDHVLISPEILPVSIQEGEGIGSDHRPLVFEIAGQE